MQVLNRAIQIPQPDLPAKKQPPDFLSADRTTKAVPLPCSILKNSRLLIEKPGDPKSKTVTFYEPKPGDLEKLIILPLFVNGLKVRALLDSGASVSLMAGSVAKKLVKNFKRQFDAAVMADKEIKEIQVGAIPTRSRISEY